MTSSLSIDIETYSSVDLTKSGVYRYVEAKDFEILLFGYSVDGGVVQVVDLARGDKIPPAILALIEDDSVIKYAFNANFERVCLSRHLGYKMGTYLNPTSWRCTMIWSAYLGLPLSLKGVGAVLNLDKQKLDVGKDLIKYFSNPCAPSIKNGGRTRNLPHHDVRGWLLFKEYNKRDVEAELAIQARLAKYPVPDFIWDEYHLDQVINDRGVLVDLPFVERAIEIDALTKGELSNALQSLTKLENPNSVMQMRSWLLSQGVETESLGKREVVKLRDEFEDSKIGEVLDFRLQLSKSSIRKYQAMKNVVCFDSRARGMFQFYGANRTARWSGRLVQLQNLPQNHLPDLELARSLVRSGKLDTLKMLYGNVPETLSQLIRTTFIPRKGYKFIVADFSAIEARVLAWLAGETWRINAFKRGDDIYCASASKMFGVPVVKNGVNAHLRQKGKQTDLSCGYGGSVGALKAMGALEMGLLEDELEPLVRMWRDANPSIVSFWWAVDKAVLNAVKFKSVAETHGLKFQYSSGMLFITLLSGRKLAYVKPKISLSKYGSECITYEGIGVTKKWERLESYGPKFVENIVQATARDILANALTNLRDYEIVMHVHDEVIIEAPSDTSVDAICNIMCKTPSWAKGLFLSAEGFESEFYKKE